eukprot:31440-Pelagococcus_subviridis.AAC.19
MVTSSDLALESDLLLRALLGPRSKSTLSFLANVDRSALLQRKYAKAVVAYSKALQVSPTSAVLLANRALAHLHLENYASAFDDSSLAIRLDPGYGYYRRGSSNFILGKFGSALKDFEKVVQLQPRNLEGKKKVRECELALRKQRFEYAIRVPESVLVKVSDSIELDTITVENTYDGPRLGENHTVTANFVKDMILQFKNCKAIHLRYAYEILLQTKSILEKVPSVIDVDIPEFFDLCNIFELNGEPSEDNPYLFNGDFVDRGSFSVEVVLTLFAFMCLCPEGCVLGKKVFIVHGGLFSKDGVKVEDLKSIDRFHEPPDEGPFCEMLWSDPCCEPGRYPSKRGIGIAFGPDVTKKFIIENNLELVIRSHEVKDDGFEIEHDGSLITVFSAPNYCDQMENKGAFIRFESDMVPHITTFNAVNHPPVRPMQFAPHIF